MKKTFRRKMLSVLLTGAMLMSILPLSSVTAEEAGDTTGYAEAFEFEEQTVSPSASESEQIPDDALLENGDYTAGETGEEAGNAASDEDISSGQDDVSLPDEEGTFSNDAQEPFSEDEEDDTFLIDDSEFYADEEDDALYEAFGVLGDDAEDSLTAREEDFTNEVSPEPGDEEAAEATEELMVPTAAQVSDLLLDTDYQPVKNRTFYLIEKENAHMYLSKASLEGLNPGKNVTDVKFTYYDKNKAEVDAYSGTLSSGYYSDYLRPYDLYNPLTHDSYTTYFTYSVIYDAGPPVTSEYFKVGAKGTCGTSVTWVLDPLTKVLTLSGTGGTYNYNSGTPGFYTYKEIVHKAVIKKGITGLGHFLFWQMDFMTEIVIPDSVTKIGDFTFQSAGLKNVTVPDTVTSLGKGVFTCSDVETVKLPSGLKEIPERFFDEAGYLKSVTIPSTVTTIGKEAFSMCFSLKSIQLPAGLKKISELAFVECDALTSITIPDSVTEIGWEAFSVCKSLEKVKLPAGLKNIYGGTFWGCESLKEITIPDGLEKITDEAFKGCKALQKVIIPASVTYIADNAFEGCPADMLIITTKGSAAEKFAKAKGFKVDYMELADLEKTILAKNDEDNLPEAQFNKLKLRVKKVGKNFVQIRWAKVAGAKGYIVYGAPLDEKFVKIADVTKASYKQTGLKKNSFYQYIVVAYSGDPGVEKVNAVSATIIVPTGGGKFRKSASVNLNKGDSQLKSGKKLKVKAKIVSKAAAGKKYKTYRKMTYESTNPAVATVDEKGRITAVAKGVCYIYAYTQDGIFKKIRIKVK